MQTEQWDGAVLNINQTCTKLGPKYIQLLGMHVLTGCDATSFAFNNGTVSALSVLEAGDFPGLVHVLGEEDAMQWDLREVGLPFLCALYGQKPGTPMEEAMYNLYTITKARPRLHNLPSNSTHLQMILWKAADQHFGWKMEADDLLESIDPGPTGHPALMVVVSCRCRDVGKICAAICRCKKEGLSCTIYCLLCQSGCECYNPHKRSQHVDDEDGKNGSMKLCMLTVLLIESECIKQRSFIAFIIVILCHLCNHSNQKVLCTAC